MRQHQIRLGFVALAAIAATVALSNQAAQAQSQSLFGGRGTTGASTSGRAQGTSTQSSSGSMFGQSSFSQGSRGGMQGQTPGSSMLGGLGILNGQSQLSNGSSLVGNGFVGRADNANEFIGRRATDGGTGTNRLGRNTRTNPRNARAGQRGNDVNNDGNVTAQRQQTVRIMSRQRIAFNYPAVSDSAVASKLQTRFNDGMKERIEAKNLSLDLDKDGVLTLHGEVPTADAKELAEMIARMEPGVRDVRNELTVGAAAKTGK